MEDIDLMNLCRDGIVDTAALCKDRDTLGVFSRILRYLVEMEFAIKTRLRGREGRAAAMFYFNKKKDIAYEVRKLQEREVEVVPSILELMEQL